MPQVTKITATESKFGKAFNCCVKPSIRSLLRPPLLQNCHVIMIKWGLKGQLVPSVMVKDTTSQLLLCIQQCEISWCAHIERLSYSVIAAKVKWNVLPVLWPSLWSCWYYSWAYSESCSQSLHWNRLILLQCLLQKTYNAYNAIADVVTLGELISHVNLSDNMHFLQKMF